MRGKAVCFKSTCYGGHDKARNEECMQVVRVLSLMHCMPCWGILQGGTVRSVIKIPLWQLWVVTGTAPEGRLSGAPLLLEGLCPSGR